MTDRHIAYTVTLIEEVREDDAEMIINAIHMVKGVLSVTPEVRDSLHHVAKEQIRHEYFKKIKDIFYPPNN